MISPVVFFFFLIFLPVAWGYLSFLGMWAHSCYHMYSLNVEYSLQNCQQLLGS